MRQLHIFEKEDTARTLADAMYAEGIESTVKATREGTHALWVHDDDDLEAAHEMLEVYRVAPDDPRFAAKAREARAQRRAEEREEKALRKRAERVSRELAASQRTGIITKFLIFACIGFAVMGGLVDGDRGGAAVFRVLAFHDGAPSGIFAPIVRGEIWRLFTPMFIYPGLPDFRAVLNLVFDMWWLRTLAAPVEAVYRGRFLAVFVAAAAAVTAVAEALFGGVFFGGMMGVVAALFAYVYVLGKTDPTSPLALPPSLAFWMVLWTVLALALGDSIALRFMGFAFGGAVGFVHGKLRAPRR